MVKGKLVSFGDNLSEVIELRKQIFNYGEEINEYAIHCLVENDKGDYIATGAIEFTGDKYVISDIGVLKEYRNQRYGDFVLRMLVNKAYMSGAEEVYSSCEENMINFFLKVGFEVESKEGNINNVKLEMKNFKTACGGNCGEH